MEARRKNSKAAEALAESDRVQKAASMAAKNRRQRRKIKLFGGAAAIVVFITTYMLILPALTLEHTPTCGYEEHTHTAECYTATMELTCGLEEAAGHTHSEACCQTEQLLVCGQAEGEDHTHSETCYETMQTIVCGQEECVGHTHTDACYTERNTLICELPEHLHTDACYPASKPEESAAETEAPEEEEELNPDEVAGYGDTGADLESQADWEATLKYVTLTGNWAQDVLAIADSQLGYHESTQNYVEFADGKRKGYSRYGAWYGSPYGDWCAMFCSFCLNYARVPTEAIPRHSGCPAWISVLQSYGLYRSAGSGYVPKAGDLIFYDWERNNDCDHVGLVYEVQTQSDGSIFLKTIEGNISDSVQYSGYALSDYRILGYGVLPENPDYVDPNAETEESQETEKKTMTFEGTDYSITVSDLENSGLPEDAELMVNELTGAAYEEKCSEALEALGADENTEITFARFFDVSFISGGQELEPENPVTVTISYAEEIAVAEEETVNVVHFADSGTEVLPVEVTQEEDGTAFVFEQESFSVSGTVITSDTVSGADWITPGAAADFRSVLGSAVYYGITANKIIKGAHMDTTFAVKTLTASENVTSGMYVNDKYGGAYWIGEINGTLKIDGSATKAYAPQNVLDKLEVNGEKITTDKSTVDAYVDAMLSHVKSQSDYLGSQVTTTLNANNISTLNNGTSAIDFTALPDGTYYILGDDFFTSGLNGIRIKLNPGQTVVFNFFSEEVRLKSYKVEVDGTSYDSATSNAEIEAVAKRVIFNMPNCTDLYIDAAIAGTVLAPHATLHGLGGTSSGWLVVDELENNRSEWHFVYQDMPEDVPVSAGFTAKKTVNGRTPTTDEQFTFILEELENGVWKTVQSVQNNGQFVGFNAISYEEEATHWYRVREIQGTDSEVTYDAAQYVYQVAVTGTKTAYSNGEYTVYDQTTTAYRVSNPENLILNGEINQSALAACSAADVTFRNLKDEYTDIKVVKVWKDSKGNSLSEEELSKLKVTVTLYRVTDDDTENPAIVQGYELSQENGWEQPVDHLPLTVVNEDGTVTHYSYYFEETAVEGATTTYSPEGRITEGTVTITNTKGDTPQPSRTSVTVNKQWFREDGTEITDDRQGTISFDLYQLKKPAGSGGGGCDGDPVNVVVYSGHWNPYTDGMQAITYQVPVGTVFTFTVTSTTTPMCKYFATSNANFNWNAYEINPTSTSTAYVYTYTVTGEIAIGIITGDNNGTITPSYTVPASSSNTENSSEQGTEPPTPEKGAYTADELIAMGAAKVGSYQLHSSSSWTGTWNFDAENGYTYTYYVIETTQDANIQSVAYLNQGTGEVTIQNTSKDESYSLPATGGAGTRWFTIAGLALMAASLVIGLSSRRKRERRPEF